MFNQVVKFDGVRSKGHKVEGSNLVESNVNFSKLRRIFSNFMYISNVLLT